MANENQEKSETTSATTAGEDAAEAADVKDQTVETETAPEKESTTATEKPQAVEESPAKAAVGVEGYNKMLADALKESAAKDDETRKEKFEKAKEIDKADAAAEPDSTPQAEAAGKEETGDEEKPAAEAADAAEEKTPERIRLGGLPDGDLVGAANALARAKKITFAEAWEKVNAKTAAEEAPAAEEGPQLRTREEIAADVEAVKAEKSQAAKDLDTVKIEEARDKLDDLKDELRAVETAERQAAEAKKAAAETQFIGTVGEARSKAIEYWPEAGDEKSDFSKRMVELSDELEKSDDPELSEIVYAADSPLVIAKMVAKELGLAPKHLRKPSKNGADAPKPSTSTAATKPAPVNQRAVGRPQSAGTPASGAARTTQGGQKEDELGLDKIRNPYEYDKLVAKLKGQPVPA